MHVCIQGARLDGGAHAHTHARGNDFIIFRQMCIRSSEGR